MAKILKTLSSIKLTFFLFGLLVLAIGLGTIFPQQGSPEDYIKTFGKAGYERFKALGLFDLYYTWWFISLGLVLFVNLTLCAWERLKGSRVITYSWKERKKQGLRYTSIAFHIGFILCFTGLFISYLLAQEGEVMVYPDKPAYISIEGKDTRLARLASFRVLNIKPLDFLTPGQGKALEVRLERFDTEYEWHQGVKFSRSVKGKLALAAGPVVLDGEAEPYFPRDWRSTLALYNGGVLVKRKTIEVNDPLHYKGITIYQSSYDQKFDLIINNAKRVIVTSNEPFEIPGLPGKFKTGTVYLGSLYKGGNWEEIRPRTTLFSLPEEAEGKESGRPERLGVLYKGRPFYLQGLSLTMANIREGSGLSYRYDPGVPVLWVATIIILVGMTIRVYGLLGKG